MASEPDTAKSHTSPEEYSTSETTLSAEPESQEKGIVPDEGAAWERHPHNPRNWSALRKWMIVFTSTLMSFIVSFGSSIFSSVVQQTGEEFNKSSELMLLGVALYVLGFAFGPMLWGPASELYGRVTPLFIGMGLFCIFQIPYGLAQNAQTLFIARFFGGLFGSAPLAIVAGMYTDFLLPAQYGVAASIWTLFVFSGPTCGPVVGSFIAKSYLGWRWTAWITMIMAVALTIAFWLVTPETYAPTVLRRRALKLQKSGGNMSVQVPEQSRHWKVFVTCYLTRPLHMLVLEPILVVMTVWQSLTYGILYLTFAAYPVAFGEVRKWSATTSTLPFLAILVGVVLACLVIAIWSAVFVGKRVKKTKKVNPEDRLPTMILGSVILPAGLFWFAWTSKPSQSWPAQVCAGIFIGAGIILVYMSALVYLIDIYTVHSNSALAIQTVIRCVVAAAFPVFGTYMYVNLGVDWASSLLGFVCLGLMPFPILFWKYGPRIRSWSKYALKTEEV